MARTLTATIVPSPWNTCVTPTLRPINPMLIEGDPFAHARPVRRHGRAEHRSERTSTSVSEERRGQCGQRAGSACASSHLDFDVDARGKRESHQRVDRLRARIEDVDEPLVSADLELLPTVLVDER